MAESDSQTARQPGLLARLFDGVCLSFNGGGSIWIFCLMSILCADVISRAVFHAPINGVPLLVELSILVIMFMQLPAAIRSGRLTRSDILLAASVRDRPSLGLSLRAAYDAAWHCPDGELCLSTLADLQQGLAPGYVRRAGRRFRPARLAVQTADPCRRRHVRHSVQRSFVEGLGELRGLAPADNKLQGGRIVRLFALLAAAFVILWAIANFTDISDAGIGVISIVFVLFFVYVGVHVGVALALISFVCVWLVRDNMDLAGKLLSLSIGESMKHYEFGVIPLFVLMGFLVSISGIGSDTYDVANHLFRKMKGGLGTATVGANAVFAAVTGTSIASASVFTKVAVPEMLRLGYRPRFSVGVVAGSSVLGMLIPPSLLLIVFGISGGTIDRRSVYRRHHSRVWCWRSPTAS